MNDSEEPLASISVLAAGATTLIAAGVNSKVVSGRLGHSSVKITLGAYTHVSQGLQKEASEEVDKALLG